MTMRGGEVRPLTREAFEGLMDSPAVGRAAAEIADAREMVMRGEMSRADFETFKRQRKAGLPVLTPHATFREGARKDANAAPSGLYMLDVDHMEGDPREFFDERVRPRLGELAVLLAHVTPSGEGLRLVAVLPAAEGEKRRMGIAEAQAWLARELGGIVYDQATRDLARSSFMVPRDYVLHVDGRLFGDVGADDAPVCRTSGAAEGVCLAAEDECRGG